MSEPRKELAKVRKRALQYRLTSDKLLVARDENDKFSEDRPCIPDCLHTESTRGAPSNQTWKHVILASVHNTATGQHRTGQEMHDELVKLVCWFPPEQLLNDCKTWRKRCKLCTGVFCLPRHEPAYQSIRSSVPFYRLQFDLVELKPTGSNGENIF